MNKQRKNEKGFTMVELIIVVAIMGIIGALLVPAFSTMSAKARLTTDIATVKTLKRTADSYKAEQGSFPIAAGTDQLDALVGELQSTHYLDAGVTFQTGGKLSVSGETFTLVVSTGTYGDAIDQLDSTAKTWITSN